MDHAAIIGLQLMMNEFVKDIASAEQQIKFLQDDLTVARKNLADLSYAKNILLNALNIKE